MAEPAADGYRIDYDDLDVEDLMQQVRARARSRAAGERARGSPEELARRFRSHLQLDDRRAYEVQQELELAGPWNVTPEDLRSSGPGARGRVVGLVRTLSRPLVRAAANLELPLYKQFKINLGIAATLHGLLRDNAALREKVADLAGRLDRLERSMNDRRGDE